VFVADLLRIHPMWVMEEYAIIFFKEGCLRPMIPPISAFIDAIKIIIVFFIFGKIVYSRMKSGPIF